MATSDCTCNNDVPGLVMRGGSESVVVSVGHEVHSGHVTVGHEIVGQSGQGSCSGHSVELCRNMCGQGLLHTHIVYI